MSSFVVRTFASGNDTALVLGNEEWVRPLFIGNVWQKIRIGILQAANPIGTTALPSGFGIMIGMCSGTGSPFGAASATNVIGVQLGVGGSAGYFAPSGNAFWAFNGLNYAVTKVASTVNTVTFGSGWSLGIPVQGVGTARRYGTIVDIARGSPNYTLTVWDITSNGTGVPSLDITPTDLLTAMAQPSAIITGGVTWGAHSTTIAASESPGVFDTVDIWSNLPGYPFELYEVAVQKLA